MNLKSLINNVPDFPKSGILFRDVSPLLNNAEALQFICKKFVTAAELENIDSFVGIESRGFIFASLLASYYKKGFVPLRKAGKLPPPTFKKSYSLEYGEATLEMAPGAGRVMILDDVLATGGTLNAAIELCNLSGYEIKKVAVLINLKFLNNMQWNNSPIFSLVDYE